MNDLVKEGSSSSRCINRAGFITNLHHIYSIQHRGPLQLSVLTYPVTHLVVVVPGVVMHEPLELARFAVFFNNPSLYLR